MWLGKSLNICYFWSIGQCVWEENTMGFCSLKRSLPCTLKKHLILTVSHPQSFRLRPQDFCFKNTEEKKKCGEAFGVLIRLITKQNIYENKLPCTSICTSTLPIGRGAQVVFHNCTCILLWEVGPSKAWDQGQ